MLDAKAKIQNEKTPVAEFATPTLSKDERLAIEEFFAQKGLPLDRAVTFADVTLPEHYSDIRTRSEIHDFSTELIPGFSFAIPVVSANMESVTGLELAVALEREGGLAIPPQTMPIGERLELIRRIGRSDSAFIDNPLTTRPERTLEEARGLMAEFGVKSLIVTDEKKTVVGILTKRDWFYENGSRELVGDLMTKKVITAPRNVPFGIAKRFQAI